MRRELFKSVLSLAMTLSLLLSVFPVMGYAADEPEAEQEQTADAQAAVTESAESAEVADPLTLAIREAKAQITVVLTETADGQAEPEAQTVDKQTADEQTAQVEEIDLLMGRADTTTVQFIGGAFPPPEELSKIGFEFLPELKETLNNALSVSYAIDNNILADSNMEFGNYLYCCQTNLHLASSVSQGYMEVQYTYASQIVDAIVESSPETQQAVEAAAAAATTGSGVTNATLSEKAMTLMSALTAVIANKIISIGVAFSLPFELEFQRQQMVNDETNFA